MKEALRKRWTLALGLTALYALVVLVYLYLEWRYEFQVLLRGHSPDTLQYNNTLTMSYHAGLLGPFLALWGFRMLGGVVLALPQTFRALYQANCAGKAVRIRWDAVTLLVIPLLFPVSGLAFDLEVNVILFYLLINRFTRDFCAIAAGYLLVPHLQIKGG